MSKNRLQSIEFKEQPITGFKSVASFYEILKDQETGVLYYCVQGGGIAMTPLLGADGKPVIDKSE